MTRKSTTFASNVLKLLTGSVIAQGIAVLVTPVLSRLFAPEAFGVAALFISISSVLVVLSCLRYELSIILPSKDTEAANLLGVSVVFVIIFSLISGFLVFFAGDIIAGALNSQELRKHLWLLPLSVLFSGLYLALSYWNTRRRFYGVISASRILASSSNQILRLSAGFMGFLSGGILIAGTVLGQFLSAVLLCLRIWKQEDRLILKSITCQGMSHVVKRYKKFPLVDVWGALLNTISWQVPTLMLAAFFSPAVVGFFALGNMVIRLPMNLLGNAISQVFYQKAAEAKNQGELSHVVREIFKRLVALGMFPMLMLCIIGEDLFIFVFGSGWAEAGIYTQILAPWMFFTFISSPLSTLFSVFERQGSALIIQTAIFLSRVLSLYIGGIMGNIYIALGLFSLSGVVIYGILSIWNLILANIKTSFFISIITKYLVLFLPAGSILFFLLHYLITNTLLILAISALIIGIYYLIIINNDDTLRSHLKSLR